jgi:GNAT superfamily N-acetyltransferase
MIHIKHPSIEQLPALAQLFDAYRVFYKKTSDVEGAITFLHERIEQKESVVFVAEMDGELVGFTQLYPLFSSTNMARMWLLNDLFVHPKKLEKGIGKLLMHAAQEHCKRTQALGISLETEKNNLPGNALYPKMGFTKDTDHNFYYWENPSFSSAQS